MVIGLRRLEGAVCSNLFSTEGVRSSKGGTLAVRELVEGLVDNGLLIRDVIRVEPLINANGIWWPRRYKYKNFNILDCALFGVRTYYLKWPTGILMKFLGRGKSYDYVICHFARNAIFAQNYIPGKKKIIYVVHNTDFYSERNKSFVRAVVEGPALVLSRSHALARKFEREFSVPVDGLALSGVEEGLISNRGGNIYKKGVLKIVVACSLVPLKNTSSTINAVKVLIEEGLDIHLSILGDGPLRGELEELCESLGVSSSVDFFGHVGRDDVIKEMRKANLFVMPSAPETFGVAYLEAMASGCVVVGHKGWGIDGVVSDGVNGYLVESPCPENIAGSILNYLSSNKSVIHLKSIETVREFTKEKVAKKYANTINRFLSESS